MLDISENEIQTESAIRIFKALKSKCSCLKTLNLANNCITKDAADEMALTLTTNNTLKALNLSHNKLQNMGIIRLMESLLTDNKTLNVLNVESNKINDLAADKIADTLTKNKSLEQLNLSSNSLKTKSAIKVINALQFNNTLKSLNMNDCDINEQAGDYITKAL